MIDFINRGGTNFRSKVLNSPKPCEACQIRQVSDQHTSVGDVFVTCAHLPLIAILTSLQFPSGKVLAISFAIDKIYSFDSKSLQRQQILRRPFFHEFVFFFQSITASLHAAKTSDSVWKGGRYQISGGSRIPKRGMRGAPTPELGQKSIIWKDFCWSCLKMKKKLTERGRPSLVPPVPPM